MKVASIRSRVGLKVRRLPAMKALFLLLIASTTAFQRAPPVVAPSRINNAPKQPRCAFPRPSHLGGTNDGLRVTSDDLVGIRGGGDGSPPSIVAKSRAFVSKNFFLIGMGVAVSFAKLLPEVSTHHRIVTYEASILFLQLEFCSYDQHRSHRFYACLQIQSSEKMAVC